MSIEQMREALIHSRYFSASWEVKVMKMSDKQIAAVYQRFLNQGKL